MTSSNNATRKRKAIYESNRWRRKKFVNSDDLERSHIIAISCCCGWVQKKINVNTLTMKSSHGL